MSTELLLIIVGMAIVTYIPRVLPLVFLNAKKIPSRLEGVLKNVPYAALGALIFPGVLFVHENIFFGLTGVIIAFTISFLGGNLIFVVIGSILILTVLTPLF
ncbi:Branched-chain amino acid transport protein [Alteribacillus persepolensis]|uniref:Branched-chain amino acid transport protein n=1 Tax=Alteribacillus persepolensis TaxID=568899 RepID=A0A1G8H3V6_9BACI|nr:AzlD domain-containing protein [Alteribacillus persepolensis]SDI01335.1 Branched-chain amino acid transport protein [Alteribacillus persepolensis]